jgi:hypothetical protein
MPTQRLDLGGGPSTNEPREFPCQAGGIGPGAIQCGATPSSRWERYCDNGHTREVRLCPSHAVLIAKGYGACTECLDKGTSAAAKLRPLDLILLGHIGGTSRG